MRQAVYPGTFDPLTLGHVYVIQAGAKLFDALTILIARHHEKKCLFSPEERKSMLEREIAADNIRVVVFDGFTVDYAGSNDIGYIIRGTRNTSDYQYEHDLANANRKFAPDIQTIFIPSPEDLGSISSSLIRGSIGLPGWERKIKQSVPYSVFEELTRRFPDAKV